MEIERKFLVRGEGFRDGEGTLYRQGYLSTQKERTVRVRIAGERAFLTVKGLSIGASRAEYEYAIPLADAAEMLDRLCEQPLIEKTRYRVAHAGNVWEIDVFSGENAGLVVAEIELPSEDAVFARPAWLGEEVTHDPRYFNSSLVMHPYTRWS